MTDRTQGILNRASEAEKFSGVRWILGDGVITNYMQSFVDETMKRNAIFQSNAGVSPKIVRRSPGWCCEWCAKLEGTYMYPDDVPDDVYRRHDNCNCVVEFYPADGKKQDVWTKEWTKAEPNTLKERKRLGDYKKVTVAQLEQRKTVGLASGNATELPKKPQRPRRSDFKNIEEYDSARAAYKAERAQYDNALNEIVAKDIRRKRKINSYNDLEAWAKKYGVDVSELKNSGIDPLIFDDIAEAETEMFERFPQVKEYREELAARYGNRSPWKIGVSGDASVEFDAPIDGLNVGRGWSDYASALRKNYDSMASGEFMQGDGTIKTLVRHEYGHSVDDTIRGRIADKYNITDAVDDWGKYFDTEKDFQRAFEQYQSEIREYESELKKLVSLDGVSEYATTNANELLAEAFAGYTSGGTSEFEKAFGKFLKRWL